MSPEAPRPPICYPLFAICRRSLGMAKPGCQRKREWKNQESGQCRCYRRPIDTGYVAEKSVNNGKKLSRTNNPSVKNGEPVFRLSRRRDFWNRAIQTEEVPLSRAPSKGSIIQAPGNGRTNNG